MQTVWITETLISNYDSTRLYNSEEQHLLENLVLRRYIHDSQSVRLSIHVHVQPSVIGYHSQNLTSKLSILWNCSSFPEQRVSSKARSQTDCLSTQLLVFMFQELQVKSVTLRKYFYEISWRQRHCYIAFYLNNICTKRQVWRMRVINYFDNYYWYWWR